MSDELQPIVNKLREIEGLISNIDNLCLEHLKLRDEDGEISISIKISNLSIVNAAREQEYLSRASKYNLPQNAVFERLLTDDGNYCVIGWEKRNKKLPIIIRDNNSLQEFKLSLRQFGYLYSDALKEPL